MDPDFASRLFAPGRGKLVLAAVLVLLVVAGFLSASETSQRDAEDMTRSADQGARASADAAAAQVMRNLPPQLKLLNAEARNFQTDEATVDRFIALLRLLDAQCAEDSQAIAASTIEAQNALLRDGIRESAVSMMEMVQQSTVDIPKGWSFNPVIQEYVASRSTRGSFEAVQGIVRSALDNRQR